MKDKENKMSPLVIEKPLTKVVKTKVKYCIGSVFERLLKIHGMYGRMHHQLYDFHGEKLSPEIIEIWTKDINEAYGRARSYRKEQHLAGNIEEMSQYYHFKRLEDAGVGDKGLTICNVGCYYCGADARFLSKHKNAVIYGLDFGDIELLNEDIKNDRLKLFPGYPLETLQRFVTEGKKNMFDYTFFTRTATLINIEQLLKYMECLKVLTQSIGMLEVCVMNTVRQVKIEVEKVDLMDPLKTYNGMYIHNYPELFNKFGFEVTEKRVLPYDTLNKYQYFSPDHYFIYTFGTRK